MRPLCLVSMLLLVIGCQNADIPAPCAVADTETEMEASPLPDAEQVLADALAAASAQRKLLLVRFGSPG